MKKFAIKAVALAAGALAAGGALAGTITLPGGAHTFAVEGLAPTTAVTTPTIVYNMGVGRPTGNGFTVIMTPNSGATFGPCVVPAVSNATMNVTVKRQSAGECAYDVQITGAASAVGDTLTWNNQTFASHTLATKGNSIAVTINLMDPSENSQVDNPAPGKTATIASSVQSINIFAFQADAAVTTTNVNASTGPLTGFVAGGQFPADSATTARAALAFDHNSIGALAPNGVAVYSFAGTASLTLAGPSNGVATNKLCIDLNNNGTECEAGEVFTLTDATTSTLANVLPGFPPVGGLVSRVVSFQADGTSQLGTSRSFAVSGTITPTLAGTLPEGLVDDTRFPAGKLASWWSWGSNASQLMSPYFNTNPNYITRFFFLNTGSTAVGYSVKCYTEGGGAVTNGAGGTLAANATTNVKASDVCTFPAATPRGGVLFTINAPIGTIKGTYQSILPDGTSSNTVQLNRPYGNNSASNGAAE